VILPMVLGIAIALLAQGWRRGSIAWLLVVAATFATMLALKLVFLACSATLGINGVHTPSGHVAAATVVTGGLAGLLLRGRRAALLLAGAAAAIIGVSRLALGAHSLPEVMIGAVAGLAGTVALLLCAGSPPAELDARRVVLVAAILAVVFHGLHLPAEAHIRSSAMRLAQFLAVCQSAETRL
jgi:membrane-associated phospholipid phosphatase